MVAASKIDNPEVWAIPDALFVAVQTHDGEADVRGLFQIGTHLLVFKSGSVAYIDGVGNSDLVVAAGATGISRSVGCVGFRTIQPAGDDGVMWLSERGVELYRPGRGIAPVSESLRGFWQGVAWGNVAANPGLAHALYLPERREYWCAVPVGGVYANEVVIVNLATGGASLARYGGGDGEGGSLVVGADGALEYRAAPTGQRARVVGGYLVLATTQEDGMAVRLDADGYLELVTSERHAAVLFLASRGGGAARPAAIGYDGFVRWLEHGRCDDARADGSGGAEVQFALVTRPLLFRAPFRRKRARIVQVLATAPEGADVEVNVRADGRRQRAHTLAFGRSVENQPLERLARVNGRGRTLQVEIHAGAGVQIAGVALQAEVLENTP
jgi:hypothetical protein